MFFNIIFSLLIIQTQSFYEYNCKDKISYSTQSNKITFTGTGEMCDYQSVSPYTTLLNSRKKINTIIISQGITYIGQNAFSNLHFVEFVDLGNVTEIGQNAFINSNIKKLVIPDSVDSIFSAAFANLRMLKNVIFSEHSQLTLIDDNAFRGCVQLSSIQLPDSLVTLESMAFEECSSLSSIFIGNLLEEIGQQVFVKCTQLQNITISSKNVKFSILNNAIFDKSKHSIIYYPTGRKEKEFVVPNEVERIGKEAFIESKLQKITFSSHLTIIEESAFYGNRHLRQIVFPQKLKQIGPTAFAGCRLLEQITFLSNVKLQDRSFVGCRKLKRIVFVDEKSEDCDVNAFELCQNIEEIDVSQRFVTSYNEQLKNNLMKDKENKKSNQNENEMKQMKWCGKEVKQEIFVVKQKEIEFYLDMKNNTLYVYKNYLKNTEEKETLSFNFYEAFKKKFNKDFYNEIHHINLMDEFAIKYITFLDKLNNLETIQMNDKILNKNECNEYIQSLKQNTNDKEEL